MPQADHPNFYFMHVGKTGGTYASTAVRKLNNKAELDMTFGAHRLHLPGIVGKDPEARVIFGLRHPLEIFTSGFFSRLRQGAPTYHSAWSGAEEKAFAVFSTPNELAEALTADDSERRRAAQHAMRSIQHVKKGLHFYLESARTLEHYRENVFFILDQEHLDEDLDRLFARFDKVFPKRLREDNARKHRNPNALDKALSPEAVANLEAHYANDIEIYTKCLEIREDIIQTSAN